MSDVNDQSPPRTDSEQSGSSPTSQADDPKGEGLMYVWDWWKFHAKQRTDMFNYFLIITGILANAYVGLLKDSHPDLSWKDGYKMLAVGLGLLGLLASAGFILLDVRNRRQIEQATKILKKIESHQLYEYELADIGGPLPYRHQFVFRAIEGVVGISWIIVLIWILLEKDGLTAFIIWILLSTIWILGLWFYLRRPYPNT